MAQITPTTVTISNGDPIDAEPLQLVIDKLNEAITLLNSHDTDIIGKASTAALTTLSNSVTTLANSLTAEAATRQNADTNLADNSVASVEVSQDVTEDFRLTDTLIARNDSGTQLSNVPLGPIAKVIPFNGVKTTAITVQAISYEKVDEVYWSPQHLAFVGWKAGPNVYCNNWGASGILPAAEEYAATATSSGRMDPFANIIFKAGAEFYLSDGSDIHKITTE